MKQSTNQYIPATIRKGEILLIILMMLGLTGVGLYGSSGKEIFLMADKLNIGYEDQKSLCEMILIDSNGNKVKRVMSIIEMEGRNGRGNRTLVTFIKPEDIRNTKLLTFENKSGPDDQWLFLPGSKRIKRISSDNKSGSFMGSEFSYSDLGNREVEKYRYKYLNKEKLEGVETFVIERYPLDDNMGYSKIISWVRTDSYQIIKSDFYDRKGEHLKTLFFKDFKKYHGKYWRAGLLEMHNVQTARKTILRYIRLELKSGIKQISKRDLK